MRYISQNIRNLLALDEVSAFHLIELQLKDGTFIRQTNLVVPVVALGVTFDRNNGLLMLSAPRLSSAVDRETFKITYVDADFDRTHMQTSVRSLFENGLAGAKLKVHVGVLNTSNAPIISSGITIPPGMPLVGVDDLIVAYAGRIDTHGYVVDPENGSVIATLEGASPMASLDLTNTFYLSKEGSRERLPDNVVDTAYDQIFKGSGKASKAWGRD